MSDYLNDITIHDGCRYMTEALNVELFTDMSLSGDAVRVMGYMLCQPFGSIFTSEEIRRAFAPIGKALASKHFYTKVCRELKRERLVMNASKHVYDQWGHIYWMTRLDNKLVKIGISGVPKMRRHQVALQIRNEVTLVKTWSVTSMIRAERVIHAHFNKFRVTGEWFRLGTAKHMKEIPQIIEDYLEVRND